MQGTSDQRKNSEERSIPTSEENPFLKVKEMIAEIFEPLRRDVDDLRYVVYGNTKDRHDLGLTSDVEINTRFRKATERFRKWLIGVIIVFTLTSLANMVYMVLTSSR